MIVMNENDVITLSLDEASLKKMDRFYDGSFVESKNEYVLFVVKQEGVTITCYKKKDREGLRKVVFQGPNAETESALWGKLSEKELFEKRQAIRKSLHPTPIRKKIASKETIGSDEVGTGDFFGPVCVVAAYCDPKTLELIAKYGIQDSKKMNDETILKIGPMLAKKCHYSSLSLDNLKYNEVHEDGLNMNAIKAKMHNRALLNLKKKYPNASACIDQFAEPKLYFSYLKGEEEVLKDLDFSVKGESVFPVVALASVIARYRFLTKMEEMGKEYGLTFPLGSGKDVDEFALKFAKKYGLDELRKVAKTNFKNFERLKEKVR